MRTSLAIAIALSATVSACGSCGKAQTAPEASAPVVEAPVAEPEGLVARVWVRAPDKVWARMQNAVSGALGLLPQDTAAMLCGVLGIDPQAAGLLDGQGTAYGVVADDPSGPVAGFAWAAALPVKDPGRLASLLLEGDAARLVARDVGGMRVLARPDRPLAATAALSGRCLLVARDEASLQRLAPYACRTMPTLQAPASESAVVAEVPGRALSGPVSARLGAEWARARAWLSDADREQRARHGGKAPDFGDPQAILDAADGFVKERLALVSAATQAVIEADAGEADLHADLRLRPGEGDAGAAVAAMHPGDTRPLADLPADAVLGLLVRDEPAARAGEARQLGATVSRTLGPRASDDDARAITSALGDWAAARGEWLSASIAWAPAQHGLWVQTPDAAGGVKSVREMVELLRRPALGEPLSRLLGLGGAQIGPTTVAGVTDAAAASFGPAGKSPLGIAWGTHEGRLLVAAGEQAPHLLQAEAGPAHRLGDDPRIGRALSALGSDASLVLLAMPLRVDATRAASDAGKAPAVVAWGRKGTDAWLRLEAAGELLREAVRLQAGL